MRITEHKRLRGIVCVAATLSATVGLVACGGGTNRYQGLTPDEIFQIATTEYEEGDYENAIEALDRLLLINSDWNRVPEARLMLGNAYFQREDYLTARAEYDRFLDRYSGHPAAPEAALGVCNSLARLAPSPQRDQSYTQDAITRCRNVVIDFAGTDQAAEAGTIANELRHTLAEKEFLNAEFYFRRDIYDAAIKYYEFVANLYPESEFAPRALLGVYLCNQAIGYDDLAEEARDRLLERYPESQAAAELRANGSSD